MFTFGMGVLARRMSPRLKNVRIIPVREVELLLDQVRTRFAVLCGVLTLAGPFIPLVALGALIASPCVHLTRQTVCGLLSALAIFLLVFSMPLVTVFLHHEGLAYFEELIEQKYVSYIEVYSPIIGYFLMLYFAVFVWVVSLDIATVVDSAKQSRRSAFKKLDLFVQLQALGKSQPTEASLVHVLDSLEDLPGWPGDAHHEEHALSLLRKGPSESYETFSSPTSRTSRSVTFGAGEGFEEHSVKEDMEFGWHKAKYFLARQVSRCRLHPYQTLLMVMIALFRACVPRMWIHFYHHRPLVPTDVAVAVMCAQSIALTAIASAIWLILFNNARIGYAENVDEMKLISALIDLEKRHTYLRTVVAPSTTSEEFGRLSQKLPYFSVGTSGNCKAWWLLRDYAVIDTMDERVTLEIAMVFVLSVLMFMMLHCVYAFLMQKLDTSSFNVLAIMDMLLCGSLVLSAMGSFVQINTLMQGQATLLIQARHGLLAPESKLMEMTDEEAAESLKAPAVSELVQLDATEFLSHLSELVRLDDHLQTLFGVEITEYVVAQVVLGMITGLGSAAGVLYNLVMKMGQ